MVNNIPLKSQRARRVQLYEWVSEWIGFIAQIFSSWLHFTFHCHTQTSIFSRVDSNCFQRRLLPGSRPRRVATISRQLILWPLASAGNPFRCKLPGWTDFQLPTSNFSCQFLAGFQVELTCSEGQNQSCFTTDGLWPISSPVRQAPWESLVVILKGLPD
jgi:hypothetical protein